MSGALDDQRLSSEAAKWRRRYRDAVEVLVGYQVRELQRLLDGVIFWELFEELIGRENVVDEDGSISIDKLVERVNAQHHRLPTLVPRRVSRADFEGVG